jgi:hypothetical protein
MTINVWDHSMPSTEPRLRNRCLTDAEHLAIENEIIHRIQKRIGEYATPDLRRVSLLIVAYLAGVEKGLDITPDERKYRNHILSNRRRGMNATDWHAMLFYADLVADAGRFAKERVALIDECTSKRNRAKLGIVPASSGSATPSAGDHEDRRASIRRVV